ncbi:Aspercryptin biosynthesis cluster protein B [Colletotrichum tropicale]|nr:Aspercryptin biosynthesis cluster protein B [Colletotrichum tropicale]
MYARTLTFALRTANTSLGAGARTMATRAPKESLCIMPDKPNVLQVRKQVKGQHYEGIKPLIESGRLVAGGAMFEKHPKEDATEAPFQGNVVVYTAESPENVKAIIENDVYATSGVWDLERMQIIPS